MLEDDLKLSSDDEESEQVRFSSVLLSCPWGTDEGKLRPQIKIFCDTGHCAAIHEFLRSWASLLKCPELRSH